MKESSFWYVYVLKLEHESWYVGTTTNLRTRIRQHAKVSPHSTIKKDCNAPKGSKGLTGKRKATHLHCAFAFSGDEQALHRLETAVTIAMGNKYGFDKVRGGAWILPWEFGAPMGEITPLKESYQVDNIRECFGIEQINLRARQRYALPLTQP